MGAWVSALLQALGKFIKENVPALVMAAFGYLRNVIKQKENENMELKTKLKIEEEKKEHEESTKNLSDADYVDRFISEGKRDGK